MGKPARIDVACWSRVKGLTVPVPVTSPFVRGVWAVTPLLDGDYKPVRGRWLVTHAPTGLACVGPCVQANRRQAERLCRALAQRFPRYGCRARFDRRPPRESVGWKAARAVVHEWAATLSRGSA